MADIMLKGMQSFFSLCLFLFKYFRNNLQWAIVFENSCKFQGDNAKMEREFCEY